MEQTDDQVVTMSIPESALNPTDLTPEQIEALKRGEIVEMPKDQSNPQETTEPDLATLSTDNIQNPEDIPSEAPQSNKNESSSHLATAESIESRTCNIANCVSKVFPTDTELQEHIKIEHPAVLSTEDPQKGDIVKWESMKLKRAISEKALEDYIFDNYKYIWKNAFDEDATLCERQKKVIIGATHIEKNDKFLIKKGQAADLYVECASGNNYLVEIKNMEGGRRKYIEAITQLLYYSVQMDNVNKLMVISTDYDSAFMEVKKKFNLPIDFIIFGEEAIYKVPET